jgi:HPr kinase/phosphorylase
MPIILSRGNATAHPAIHATVVAINGWGVALYGASGSGKSDLALRLIDRNAILVGDDYVQPDLQDGRLLLRAIPRISGKMEIRGIGIVEMPFVAEAYLRLVVILGQEGRRLPEKWPTFQLGTFDAPVLHLDGLHASAALRVEYALKSVVDADMWPVPSAVPPSQGQGQISR